MSAKPKKDTPAITPAVSGQIVRRELSRMEKLFVRVYLDCFDVGKAAKECGCYVPNGLSETQERLRYDKAGRKIMRRSYVAEAVEQRVTNSLRGIGVERGKVLAEICYIAFSRAGRLFDEEGRVIPLSQLDEATQAAIIGLEVEDIYEGRGEDREWVGRLKKYKLASKTEALKMLGSHLRLFAEKEVADNKDRLQELVDAMRRPVNDGAVATPVPRLMEGEFVEPSSQK